ncbi:MAG: beta-ketoacyl-[acyl-carrier-protein] synthase family protein [Dissulfurispiraceae bacterium]|jgi:3-oxoacyl-[acyl-carrier-protein] synthase II
MKRVVITGIGAVTPIGLTFKDSWDSIKAGRSGIKEVSKVIDARLRWRSAGEIRDMQSDRYLSKKEANFVDPCTLYSVAAASEALETSGLSIGGKVDLDHAGIIVGSSKGGISTIEKQFEKLAARQHASHLRLSPHLMSATTVGGVASFVAMKLGIKGYCLGISNACPSGLNAIGEAFRLIRNGMASIVFAGGADAPLCRFCIEGYGATGALSRADPDNASRPFDKKRDGFVPAEGASILLLEELQSALRRSAPIFGEVIGYSNICDPLHLTKPSTKGEILAIKNALSDAEILTADVDYVSAHGTSTKIGDMVEAQAICCVFRDRELRVSAIKSMTGHMLAASGAFEVACTALSIKEGIIPPTIKTDDIDPECDINVSTTATRSPIEIAIINSFGFGGVSAVLVLKKYPCAIIVH